MTLLARVFRIDISVCARCSECVRYFVFAETPRLSDGQSALEM